LLNRVGWAPFRERLWLRKRLRAELGRHPTTRELREAMESTTINKKDLEISARDITDAFDEGLERFDVEGMEYRGYKEDLQRDFIRYCSGPEQPRAAKKAKKTKKKRPLPTDRRRGVFQE